MKISLALESSLKKLQNYNTHIRTISRPHTISPIGTEASRLPLKAISTQKHRTQSKELLKGTNYANPTSLIPDSGSLGVYTANSNKSLTIDNIPKIKSALESRILTK